MGNKPRNPDELSAVGRVLEYHRALTECETTDKDGNIQKLGFRNYSQLARAIDKDESYVSRIRYDVKVRVNTSVWWDIAVALANAQLAAGIGGEGTLLDRAKFIMMDIMAALIESPTLAQIAEEFLRDLAERRAIREEQDERDKQAWKEKREDDKRRRDSERRRKKKGDNADAQGEGDDRAADW